MVRGLVCGGLAGLLMGHGAALRAQETPGTGAPSTAAQAPAGPVGQQVQMGGMTDAQHGPVKRAQADASTALTVTVEGRTRTIPVKELEAMPQRTVTVQNGHTNAQETYTGVAVSDLLAQMGVAGDAAAVRARVLRSYLRATGSDFYYVLYSGVEVMGTMHTGEVIVALKRNGEGLGSAGELMLVSTEDKVPARWVHNLTSMTLSSVD